MEIETPPQPDPRRARRLALALAAVAVVLAVGGAVWLTRTQVLMQSDPALTSRTPAVLDRLLARAEQAEQTGNPQAAAAMYRSVLSVGIKGDSSLELYMAAARRGLARLGALP